MVALRTEASEITRATFPEITNIDDFYRLPPEQMQQGRPLRFQGTVVYYDPAWGQFHLYDGRITQYLYPSPELPMLKRGQKIELTGHTLIVNGTYRYTNAMVRSLDVTRLPSPLQTSIASLGSNANQLVEVVGMVRGVNSGTGRVELNLADADARCRAFVLRYPVDPNLRRWVGKLIRIRGINGSRIADRRLEAMLYVAETNDMSIAEGSAEPPSELPSIPIRSLLGTVRTETQGQLVHVQGIVTSKRAPDSLTIKDPTGVMLVRTSATENLEVDQRVDVWGFPEVLDGQPILADAFCEVFGRPDPQTGWVPPVETLTLDKTLRWLETTRDVRSLSAQEAVRHYPVKLQTVVTYADADWGNGFLLDHTGGIYVVLGKTNLLSLGQKVEVTGFTDTGTFTPFIVQPQFKVLGTANLPAPIRVSLDTLMSGEYDSYWIQLDGVIRRSSFSEGRLSLDLTTHRGPFRAIIPGVSTQAGSSNWVDALVLVTGACGADLNARGQLAGIVIHCPNLDHVKIIQPSQADPFAAPTSPLDSLNRKDLLAQDGHRVRVSGVVTYTASDLSFTIQDSSGAARVWAAQTNKVQLGEALDVVAWPTQGDFAIELRDAIFRTSGRTKPPRPVLVTADQILRRGTNDAQLVEIEGRLLEVKQMTGTSILLMQQGSVIFEADLPARNTIKLRSTLQPGSRLRLTGVCSIQSDQRRDPKSFQILLRSIRDAVVLKPAPWWTPQHAVFGFTTALLVIGLAMAWILLLRHQVKRQTEIIQQRLAKETALEKRYQDLVENAWDIVFTSDLEGRITSFNRAAERISGYSKAEALQLRIEDLVVPEQRAMVQERLTAGRQETNLAPFETRMLTRDGRKIYLEVSSRLVFQDGRPSGLEGIARDITERKRAETLLRKSEEHFSKIFHVSPIAISITRLEDGYYYDANKSFLRLVEYAQEELIGHTSGELNIWADPDDRAEMVCSLRKSPSISDMEILLRSKTGKIRRTLASLELIELDGQSSVLGIMHDITERLQLEEQFRQAQKMESVGQLAAGIAHDFNNLLTVIQGYTALLESGEQSADQARECVQHIAHASQRAANVTRQLLAFSRRQAIRLQPVNLNDIVNNMTRMLPHLLGETIQLQVLCQPALPEIDADAGMLEQAIMNMAINARDSMPHGGQLVFATRSGQFDEQSAGSHPEAAQGEFVCLSVTDTGCGMDAATLGHMFEPFFTTKEVGKGSGLGLATAYGIVKQHRGWIEVTSQLGQGSTFRMYLPVSAGNRKPDTPVLASESTLPTGKGTILLVEDEPALRHLTQRVLSKQGFHVLEATSGVEALRVWANREESICMLVTDMVMPGGVGGHELANRLLAEDSNLRVLYTSGYSAQIVGSDFVLKEGVNFLSKPYLPSALIKAVADCLANPPATTST